MLLFCEINILAILLHHACHTLSQKTILDCKFYKDKPCTSFHFTWFKSILNRIALFNVQSVRSPENHTEIVNCIIDQNIYFSSTHKHGLKHQAMSPIVKEETYTSSNHLLSSRPSGPICKYLP